MKILGFHWSLGQCFQRRGVIEIRLEFYAHWSFVFVSNWIVSWNEKKILNQRIKKYRSAIKIEHLEMFLFSYWTDAKKNTNFYQFSIWICKLANYNFLADKRHWKWTIVPRIHNNFVSKHILYPKALLSILWLIINIRTSSLTSWTWTW